MKRAMMVYLTGVILGALVAVAASLALPEEPAWARGIPFLVLMPLPLIMAYVAHRSSGAIGNPFRGLQWGPAGWFFLVWGGGVLLGLVAVGLAIGLGMARFDPEMSDYIRMNVEAAEAQSGQEMDSSSAGMFKIGGYITAAASPTIGAWIVGAIICLGTFPWLGWYFRRLLPRGRSSAIIVLIALFFLFGLAGGVPENPQVGEMPLALRMALAGLNNAAAAVVLIWLFLRTRSAVIPALALGSYQAMLGAATVFLSDANQVLLMATGQGLMHSLVLLLAGIGLWVMKDPGGSDLAVAAVAGDGTPLTPEQLERQQAEPVIAPEPILDME